MPRRKNTRPTLIYWLLDIRPETIAAGWSVGKPFYCGKTVKSANARLNGHFSSARRRPQRLLSRYLQDCGVANVQIRIMETVPADGKWAERERFWIRQIRHCFGGVNICEGGEGVPGLIPSASHRAKLSAAGKGRKHSAESLAKMRMVQGNRNDEWRQNLAVALTGKTLSDDTKRKIAEHNRGKQMPESIRAKISAANSGQKRSQESRKKISAALTGKPHSKERCENNSRSKMLLWQDPEYRNKVVAAHSGKEASESTKQKMRIAQQLRRQREAAAV